MKVSTLFLQTNRQHFIDSSTEFNDYLMLRNAHFAYSNVYTADLSQMIGR